VASQSFSHTASFASSTETAWSALQQAETWAAIGGVDDISGVRTDDDGHLRGYAFAATVAGKRYPGRAHVVSTDPGRRMVMEIDTSELTGTIAVTIDEAAHSGTVTVDMKVSSRSFLGSMVFPLIAAAIGSGLRSNVEAFAAGLD
jgi:hypothetical protein